MDTTNDREWARYQLKILFKDSGLSDREFGEITGRKLFELETEQGVPLELSYDFIKDYKREVRAWAAHYYQILLIRHKLSSGLNDKNLKKAQLNNRKEFYNLIK